MPRTLLQLRQAKQSYEVHFVSWVGAVKAWLCVLQSAQGHIIQICAMIITLVIQNGSIALNLISEHKTEAKWVSG